MDVRRRFELLAHAAALDRDARRIGLARAREVGAAVGVTKVRLPGGKSMGMMRVMQTNACSLACGYCPTFCGGEVKRATLAPEEIASAFAEARRRGIADGLFLTSGVPGRPERATDRMLATIEVLRRREGFRGYVHVKMLPGAERAQVERAVQLATRVSVNLEAPADGYVKRLAPDKDLSGDLLPKLELAGRLSREAARERGGPGARASTTTQFVVGAAGERDREILAVVARLERQSLLHHAHFSAFQPVAGTPMEGEHPTPAVRELRLYQAEHLLREYGFAFDELVFERDGNLTLDHDPKTSWALAHPEHFPLAVESAPVELLLRVPGIGPATARALARERRRVVFRWAGDLRGVGVDTVRAGWFLTLRGRRLASSRPAIQLRLFAHGDHLTHAASRTAVPPCAFR
jgi:predicted DNA-binding helix-hairpin-helix protein